VILGRVFHAVIRDPLAQVFVLVARYPAAQEDPPLAGGAGRPDGSFEVETHVFTGSATLLVIVRNDGFAEALRRVEVMAGRCLTLADVVTIRSRRR